MLVKQRFYYRAHDSTQHGILGKKIVMSLRPVRSDRSVNPLTDNIQRMHLFWDEGEGVWQDKVVYIHQLSENFEEYHST